MAYFSDKFGRRPPAIQWRRHVSKHDGPRMGGLASLKRDRFQLVAGISIHRLHLCKHSRISHLTIFNDCRTVSSENAWFCSRSHDMCRMSFINIKAYPTIVESFGNELIFMFYGFRFVAGNPFRLPCAARDQGQITSGD